MKIVLVGNPNVGKSTLFSRLTGTEVTISNYAGTTVEYKKGIINLNGEEVELIDVPGIYSLKLNSKAEKVLAEILKDADIIINVVDATNLERNLFLTMELLENKVPVILSLNYWNETKHEGIKLDIKKLEKMLKIPVIPTVAITAKGSLDIITKLNEIKRDLDLKSDIKNKSKIKKQENKKEINLSQNCNFCHNNKSCSLKPNLESIDLARKNYKTKEEKWIRIENILDKSQKIKFKRHTFLENIEDLTIKPMTGIPIAITLMLFLFYSIRFIGEGLINYIFNPIFELFLPYLQSLSQVIGPGFLHDLIIGQLIDGKIDYLSSMGLISTGLYVPIGMVLPYILAFYLMLGILEDTGYLPRLTTLVDSLFHKVGLHGLSIVPLMLGLGCNVPGVLATRILESKKQRFIVITLMSITIPCMAQIAMIYGLLGPYGIKGLGIVFLTLVIVWIILAIILNKIVKGNSPETFIEITPYRIPRLNLLYKKMKWRLKSFIKEAIPFMLLGVFIVNIFYISGFINFLGNLFAPIISGIFGLPEEAIGSLLLGFLRKDVAVGMLVPLGLTLKQLIISSVILTMYFPCIATFVMIFKELGWKYTLKATILMFISTTIVGGVLNLIL